MVEEKYWKDLISMACRDLQKQGKAEAVYVIRNSKPHAEFAGNNNGIIDYWDLVFYMPHSAFETIKGKEDTIVDALFDSLFKYHTNDKNEIVNIQIKPTVEHIIDWQVVFPETKESTIHLIEEEMKMLTEVATGTSYTSPGMEEVYQQRHQKIIDLSEKAGFDYPIVSNSLAEWWIEIQDYGKYTERRAYISKLFHPILQELRKSEDIILPDLSVLVSQSEKNLEAIENAQMMIREGKYNSAVDRIHTAFHGYLRELNRKHGIDSDEDNLPAVYSKLYKYYSQSIQSPKISERVENVLKSASGMIHSINELRNKNSLAHPNEELIQRREAELVINLVCALASYISNIEKDLAEHWVGDPQ